MTRLMAFLVAANIFIGGCSTQLPLTKVTGDRNGIDIHAVRVIHETKHYLALEVDYSYDHSLGDCVFVGATTSCSGAGSCKEVPRGSWGYTPSRIEPGRNRGRVLISMGSRGPDSYVSDELNVTLYEGGKGTVAEAQVRFEKHWVRNSSLPTWVKNWCALPRKPNRSGSSCRKP